MTTNSLLLVFCAFILIAWCVPRRIHNWADLIVAAVAACKVKDEALRDCAFDESGYCINPDAEEALAVMPSISEWKTLWQKEIESLRQQVTLYEQALIASWPEGAKGDAFNYWNEARKLAATGPKP